MNNLRLCLALILCLCMIQNSFTATCGDNCMACDSSTGLCLPYSCKYNYYRNGTTCSSATSDPSGAIFKDDVNTMANCQGFNRINASSTTTCQSSTNTCKIFTFNN